MRTDIHSHLLPGIDDGAADLAASRRGLSALTSVGITHLALTPHFYPMHTSFSHFLERREGAWQKLQTVPEAKNFVFSLGAEVYFTENLFNHHDLSSVCYRGTRLMLTELETKDHFTPVMEKNLICLIEDYGITPVLAHIERYPFLHDRGLLSELRRMGCMFQLNLECFSSFLFRKKWIGLAETYVPVFLGQDVHHLPLTGKKREAIFDAWKKNRATFPAKADDLALSSIFNQTK